MWQLPDNIADKQIQKKQIPESDIEIYKYGYKLLFEKILIFILIIFIAFVLKAWKEILLFYIAFVPIRVYSGGYHAKKTVSYMALSSFLLIFNIITVHKLNTVYTGIYPVVLELVLFMVLYSICPVETENRKISSSEKRYFHKMVSGIYLIEIIIETLLLYFGYSSIANSFITAHCTNVIIVLAGSANSYTDRNKR